MNYDVRHEKSCERFAFSLSVLSFRACDDTLEFNTPLALDAREHRAREFRDLRLASVFRVAIRVLDAPGKLRYLSVCPFISVHLPPSIHLLSIYLPMPRAARCEITIDTCAHFALFAVPLYRTRRCLAFFFLFTRASARDLVAVPSLVIAATGSISLPIALFSERKSV